MLESYSKVLSVEDEHPADTDLRTVMRHLDEWLPIGEMAGLRLFENDLKNLPGSRIVKTIKTLPLYSPEMLRH
jgi:hypothetical protein